MLSKAKPVGAKGTSLNRVHASSVLNPGLVCQQRQSKSRFRECQALRSEKETLAPEFAKDQGANSIIVTLYLCVTVAQITKLRETLCGQWRIFEDGKGYVPSRLRSTTSFFFSDDLGGVSGPMPIAPAAAAKGVH